MRKTNKEIYRHILEARQLRWEFIRRNKNYQIDYRKYKKAYGAVIKRLGAIPKSWQLKKQVYFLEKWGIEKAMDYNEGGESLEHSPIASESAVELCVQRENNQNKYENPLTNELIPEYAKNDFNTSLNETNCRYIGRIVGGKFVPFDFWIGLRINLSYPKERLKYEFKRVIDEALTAVKKSLIDERVRSEYRTYLQIYDLRKERKTYRQIAKIVYPDDYKKLVKYKCHSEKYAVAPVTEKVKNNLKACQKLIEGGYKIIR